MRRVALPALVLGLLIGACGSDPAAPSATEIDATTPVSDFHTTAAPTTVPAPPDWAAPIVTYVETLLQAADAGDTARLFPFFTEDATLWFDTARTWITLVGGSRQLLSALDSFANGPEVKRAPALLFLSWGPTAKGAPGFWANVVVEADYGDTRQIELVSLAGREDVLYEWLRSPLAADARVNPPAATAPGVVPDLAAQLDDIERQYLALAEAWSAHDIDAILGTTGGLEPGPGDVDRVEATKAILAAGFAAWPESYLEPLSLAQAGLRDTADPVVFFRADADTLDLEDEMDGFGVYRLHLDTGTSALVGVHWKRRGGIVVQLDTILELQSLDAIGAEVGIDVAESAGYWPDVPTIERTRTGSITTFAGEVIELYNAAPIQADLTAWAVARYEEAGLPAPAPRSVGFPPDLRCAVVSGVAVDTGTSIDLQLCAEADAICAGDGCLPSAVARSTMLHELGHVWTIQNLDEADRQRFLDSRGLAVWSDPGTERDLLGTEHAAEVLSWGLMDEDTWGARLPDSDCTVLTEAFEVLTGLPPLRTCPPE